MNKNIKKGFTIIEIMVAVSIGAIILTLSFVNANKARIKARDKTRVADINTIRLAIEEYRLHCGEYPARIEAKTHNGCYGGEHLSDYLPYIPVPPKHENSVLFETYSNSLIDKPGYFYTGLTSSSGTRCYDYHIGAELEVSEQNFGKKSKYLNVDHDAKKNSGKYNKACVGSNSDFGDLDGSKDDDFGLYDFRSDASF